MSETCLFLCWSGMWAQVMTLRFPRGNVVSIKKYLPENIYGRFKATYSNADYGNMWKAAFDMLYLFGDVARIVAAKLEFTYDESEKRHRGNIYRANRLHYLISYIHICILSLTYSISSLFLYTFLFDTYIGATKGEGELVRFLYLFILI